MSVFSEMDAVIGVEEELENEAVSTVGTGSDDVTAVTDTENTTESKVEKTSDDETKITAVKSNVSEEVLDVPEIDYDNFRPIFNFEGLSEGQIIDGALNRLMQDTYFSIDGMPLIACFLYVYNKAKQDIDFAKQVLIKSKNFAKAFKYLRNEVSSLADGTRGVGLDHRQIFAIIEDYYAIDDAEIAKKEAIQKAKQKAKIKAKATPKATPKASDTKKKPKEDKDDGSLSLFSMM